MNLRLFLIKRIYEFDLGRYFSSLIQFILTIAIFVKVYNTNHIVIFIVLGLIGIWLLGFILQYSKFNELFQKESPTIKEILKKLDIILKDKEKL
jgi:hypothetical protein